MKGKIVCICRKYTGKENSKYKEDSILVSSD